MFIKSFLMRNTKGNDPNYALLYELYYGKKPNGVYDNKGTTRDKPAEKKRQKKGKRKATFVNKNYSSRFQSVLSKVHYTILKMLSTFIPPKRNQLR